MIVPDVNLPVYAHSPDALNYPMSPATAGDYVADWFINLTSRRSTPATAI